MTFASYITLFRLLLIPLFVGSLLSYSENMLLTGEFYRYFASIFFILAAFSDFLDGYVARKFHQQTRLGMLLDPVADKALNLSAFITLHTLNIVGLEHIPLWLVVLVVSREALLIIGGVAVHMGMGSLNVHTHWSGKAATCLQMILIACVLLKLQFIPFGIVEWLTGAFVAASLGLYLLDTIHTISSSSESK
jgi:CDP-diacylglycerol--glycerol-3-phosphate 3-phosphatidyltransferase